MAEDVQKDEIDDISRIKKDLDVLLSKRRNFSSTDLSEIDISLKKIREKTSHCKTNQTYVKDLVHYSFFGGDLTPTVSEDEEMKDEHILQQADTEPAHQEFRMPLLNTSSSAFMSPQHRIMNENMNFGIQSGNRISSLFDMLLQKNKNNSQIQNNVVNQPQNQNENREAIESSSLIENLLTEYLISLPSSLEEFYKVMGEIYVAEILKQCPHIGSPAELMKLTLLGPK